MTTFKSLSPKSSDAESKAHIARARKYFAKTFPRYADLADDFAQWCVLKWLEGFYPDGRLHLMCLDFFDSEFRHLKNRVDQKSVQKLKTEAKLISELKAVAHLLDRRHKTIFLLHYKWGMTAEEIGECVDMTPESVMVNLSLTKQHIKKLILIVPNRGQ